MASIKGPRSALTDFIEENNLKIDTEFVKRRKAEKIEEIKDKKPVQRTKKIKQSMPVELINLETLNKSPKDLEVEEILSDHRHFRSLTEEQLVEISSYLSRNRIYSIEYYRFIIQRSSKRLVIYDCSEMKDKDYHIDNKLKCLELYQCGQLTSNTINGILNNQEELEVLKLTGGYLLTDLELPKKLKILDLTHCSRLDDSIIEEINIKCKHLEELRLSYCYKIEGSVNLKIPVKRLYLCETKVREEFILKIPKIQQIRSLSVKRCQEINNLPLKFKFLEYLDIEGITEIDNLHLTKHLKVLNCKQCYGLDLPLLLSQSVNLEELNISYLTVDQKSLLKMTKLRILDLSWCSSVDDDLIRNILKGMTLEKIFVFGCFNLSPTISETSWKDSESTMILGNPAETKYLILND